MYVVDDDDDDEFDIDGYGEPTEYYEGDDATMDGDSSQGEEKEQDEDWLGSLCGGTAGAGAGDSSYWLVLRSDCTNGIGSGDLTTSIIASDLEAAQTESGEFQRLPLPLPPATYHAIEAQVQGEFSYQLQMFIAHFAAQSRLS